MGGTAAVLRRRPLRGRGDPDPAVAAAGAEADLADGAGGPADGRRQLRPAVHGLQDRLTLGGVGRDPGRCAVHDLAVRADPRRTDPLATRPGHRPHSGGRGGRHVEPAWPGIVRGALADRRGGLHRLAGRGDDEAGRGREAAAVPGLGGLLVLLAAGGDERAYRAWTSRGWLS